MSAVQSNQRKLWEGDPFEAVLTPLPWARWSEHVWDGGADRWFWSDLDGAHLESAPPSSLLAVTHVWAWSGQRYWRWRCRGEVAVGARLDLDGAVDGGTMCEGARVESQSWRSGDMRTRVTEQFRARGLTLLQVSVPVQLQFLRVHDRV